jgi:hypothetical protein
MSGEKSYQEGDQAGRAAETSKQRRCYIGRVRRWSGRLCALIYGTETGFLGQPAFLTKSRIPAAIDFVGCPNPQAALTPNLG